MVSLVFLKMYRVYQTHVVVMLTTYLLLTIQVNITRFFADSLYLFKSVNCLQNVSLDKKEEGGKRTVNLELNKGSILLVLENIKDK